MYEYRLDDSVVIVTENVRHYIEHIEQIGIDSLPAVLTVYDKFGRIVLYKTSDPSEVEPHCTTRYRTTSGHAMGFAQNTIELDIYHPDIER